MKKVLLAVIGAMAQASALADTTINTATTAPLTLNNGNLTITSAGSIVNSSNTTVYTNGAVGTIGNAGAIDSSTKAVWLDASADAVVNSGTITAGEIGIFNVFGTLGTLTNTGSISDRAGAAGGYTGVGNSGTITTLNNSGTISGVYGIANAGTITSLTNSGTISGSMNFSAAGNTFALFNGGTITSLNNSGTITGTEGIYNAGTITSFTNSGTISGSSYALYNVTSGTLGAIDNSGSFQGNIFSQSSGNLTINGSSGSTFGTLTGYNGSIGTITNTASDVVFGSGSLLLNDNIDVGTHNVTNTAATLKVNNPIAITGNYTQASGGTLQIGVAGMTNYGKLTVSDTAALGGTLYVDAASAAGLSAGTLSSVVHAGSISGTFDNVTDNSTLFDFTPIYTATDVSLNVKSTSQTGVYNAVAATGNTPSTGASRVLDNILTASPTGAIATLFQPLSSQQAVSNAVSQTLPLLTAGSTIVAQSVLGRVSRIVQSRQDGVNGLSSGDPVFGDKEMWIKPFGSWADQHDRGGVSGYSANTGGLALGADAAISPVSRLGVAFAYANSSVTGNSSVAPNSATVDVYQLLGYGSRKLDENTELTYQAGLGRNATDGRRTISFASGTADASYRSLTATAGIGLEKTVKINEQTSFLPSIRADYAWIKDRAYRETGSASVSPLLLDVASRSSDELILGANGKINHKLNRSTTVNANAGVGYDAINKNVSILASYAGASGASFVTYGIDQSPWLARGGLGLVHKTKGGTEVNVRYDAEYRTGFLNHSASAKMNWAF